MNLCWKLLPQRWSVIDGIHRDLLCLPFEDATSLEAFLQAAFVVALAGFETVEGMLSLLERSWNRSSPGADSISFTQQLYRIRLAFSVEWSVVRDAGFFGGMAGGAIVYLAQVRGVSWVEFAEEARGWWARCRERPLIVTLERELALVKPS